MNMSRYQELTNSLVEFLDKITRRCDLKAVANATVFHRLYGGVIGKQTVLKFIQANDFNPHFPIQFPC